MIRPKVLGTGLFATMLFAVISTSMAQAQELPPNEVSVQGIGFFTKDSNNNGVVQHTTDSGGFLVSYRNRFSRLFGADLSYGYTRNTQLNFTSVGGARVQADVHQTTAALVAHVPGRIFGLRPFALAGAGALTFNPTNNFGADTQAKAAFVYGGGADYDINDHFALRLEYRGLLYKRPDFGLTALNSDALTHTAQPSAGFLFRF
ncbi:MAG: porin family protein [Chloracidobacterium sp.]|nr:porin family protein [Chloracidobacterium sp.]